MDYIFNEQTHKYEIDKYDEAVVNCQKFIENNNKELLPIIDETTYKQTWKARTIINNKLKEIQKFRKQTNGVVLGDFNCKSLSLEKMLSEESDRLTKLMETFEPKEPIYVFKEIRTKDKVAYDKLIAYAKKLNLITEEK